MRFIITIYLAGLSFFTSFSQTGKIEGKVTDAKLGTPLSGVTVTVARSEKGGATDIDGQFVLTLNAGKHTIRLTSVGYTIKELSDIEVKAGAVTNFNNKYSKDANDASIISLV